VKLDEPNLHRAVTALDELAFRAPATVTNYDVSRSVKRLHARSHTTIVTRLGTLDSLNAYVSAAERPRQRPFSRRTLFIAMSG
jgi:hypothetical protein